MKAKISKSFYRLMNQVRSGLASACIPSKLVMIMVICMPVNACSGEIDKTKNITVDGQTINYDKIYTDVSQLLNVKPNTKEVFVRWELPIRYYVAGLQEYPDVAEQLDQVAQKMAELTGLDIKRHDKIYWPPQDTKHHPDSPEHHFTNVHFFFSPDFDSLVKESEYIRVAEVIGSSREREREKYYLIKDSIPNEKSIPIALMRSSGSNQSLMYYNFFGQLRSKKDIPFHEILHIWMNVLSSFTSGNEELMKLSNRKKITYGSERLKTFDVFFIKATYRQNSLLKHGLNNEKAAAIIAQDIWQQYQTEGV